MAPGPTPSVPHGPEGREFFFTSTGYAGLRRLPLGGNHVFTLWSSGDLWNGRGAERACCVDPPCTRICANTEHLCNGCVHRELAPSRVAELNQIWLDLKKACGKITRGSEAVPIRCADRFGLAVGGTYYLRTRTFIKNTKAKTGSTIRGAKARENSG